jgi:hypothetical protein
MIKVLVHYTPSWRELAMVTVPISELYCSKHGYGINSYECTSYQYYNGKEKLKHILEGLNEGDVALVMDADAIITNLTTKIESFIDDEHDFYITNHLGKCNAGIFIIRKTKWAVKFINYLLENIGKEKVYCEQDAIPKYQSENPHEPKIKILNHPSINSFNYNLYPEHKDITEEEQGMWQHGNFILHLPGIGQTERQKYLTNIKEQIIYE